MIYGSPKTGNLSMNKAYDTKPSMAMFHGFQAVNYKKNAVKVNPIFRIPDNHKNVLIDSIVQWSKYGP